jgi:hypothetical protein
MASVAFYKIMAPRSNPVDSGLRTISDVKFPESGQLDSALISALIFVVVTACAAHALEFPANRVSLRNLLHMSKNERKK